MASILYSSYISKLQDLQRTEKRITTPPFYLMVLVAFLAHFAVLAVVNFVPSSDIINIPINHLKLNIGLGNDIAAAIDNRDNELKEALREKRRAEAEAFEKARLAEIEKQKIAREQRYAKYKKRRKSLKKSRLSSRKLPVPTDPLPIDDDAEISTRIASAAPVSAVSQTTLPPPIASSVSPSALIASARSEAANGEGLGDNSEQSAEQRRIKLRYTALISKMIDKHKLVPKGALDKGLAGRSYLRVQIARNGEIDSMWIHKSSGHQIFDSAALSAARRADPLPPVPDNYQPKEKLLGFVIAIQFN